MLRANTHPGLAIRCEVADRSQEHYPDAPLEDPASAHGTTLIAVLILLLWLALLLILRTPF